MLNLNRTGQKIARELYEKSGESGYLPLTLLRFMPGRSEKAVKVMEALPPEQVRQPEIAAYYGIILAAAGDHARAAEFLDLSETATLLPQEKALVEKARRSLAQG